MKRVYVNEDWCLGCHLCEFYCAFANSGETDMAKAFKLGKNAAPRIRIEEGDGVNFAVQCRHCTDPLCVKGCIAGALSINNGVIEINKEKCVGCYTCVLSCPYGCIVIDPKNDGKTITKCELCTRNNAGEPACAANCPNRAIVFEERGEE
ncbi:MAG: 4Fe-4S dicluster domain-containing protein [Huintestinicola sp.]